MAEITFTSRNAIAFVALNRPAKLNALTPEMLSDLAGAVREAESRSDLRALVIHGEGRAFCVGADINIWAQLTPEAFRTSWINAGHAAFSTLARCRLPVIAAVHGPAFGGGLELALAADIRLADAEAMFALPEVSLGTVPGWGGSQRLPGLIGRARAKQMVLAAERVSASRAESWGLVNETCPAGSVLEAAEDMAARVAKLAPVAVQLAKRMIDGAEGEGLDVTLEMLAGMATQATQDMREGTAALLGKRAPRFTGE